MISLHQEATGHLVPAHQCFFLFCEARVLQICQLALLSVLN